jgi:hypothetical protein
LAHLFDDHSQLLSWLGEHLPHLVFIYGGSFVSQYYIKLNSYSYVFFFAVNHWTTEAGVVDNTNTSQVNWGVLQVVNSSNFALNSTFWTHIAGGLNF